ncbi:MAG: carbohydrate ABC transporter permease [Shimia sp.]
MSPFTPRRIGQMSPGGAAVTYALLTLWALVVLFPIYWLIITSFKSVADVNAGPVFLPWVDFTPSLHAWRDLLVLDWEDTRRAYVNSIVIASASTALSVLIGSMAAYALARVTYAPRFSTVLLFVLAMGGAIVAFGIYGVDWRIAGVVAVALFLLSIRALGNRFAARLGNGDILFWMISQRILAPVVVVVPIYMMFQTVGLLDTHLAIILTYAVVNLPIVVWLMYDFFASIPRDLEESAQLDGATMFTVFREVVLPLSKTGLAATTLLVMILAWNEYLFALFLSTADAQTMPILVAAMNAGERGILWWTMSAVIVVMILPVLALAIVLQRFIAKGLLTGAVKG